MYSGYLDIELANERVRERRRAAEAYRLVKQARQVRAPQITNRGVPCMGPLLNLLGRTPKHANAEPEIAAGVQDQWHAAPNLSGLDA
jgi:hypothetical protein